MRYRSTTTLTQPATVVAFGGGTGLSTLLAGMKHYTDRIHAVVSVADDGGSSGRLRKEFDIIAPGDIRNCLVALADAGPALESLFQYRFGPNSDLEDHAFGNLFLAVLAKVTGDIRSALAQASQILNVRGQVLPATDQKVALVAEHPDGTKSTGEVQISRASKPIDSLVLRPTPPLVSPDIMQAIQQADVIILGPGSLYTSIIPPLLVPGAIEALREAVAPKVYVCNVMTQPGETSDFTVKDHLDVLERHTMLGLVDYCVVNTGAVDDRLLVKYEAEGQKPVRYDAAASYGHCRVVTEDLVSLTDVVRHDGDRLARLILSLIDRYRGTLSRRLRRVRPRMQADEAVPPPSDLPTRVVRVSAESPAPTSPQPDRGPTTALPSATSKISAAEREMETHVRHGAAPSPPYVAGEEGTPDPPEPRQNGRAESTRN